MPRKKIQEIGNDTRYLQAFASTPEGAATLAKGFKFIHSPFCATLRKEPCNCPCELLLCERDGLPIDRAEFLSVPPDGVN